MTKLGQRKQYEEQMVGEIREYLQAARALDPKRARESRKFQLYELYSKKDAPALGAPGQAAPSRTLVRAPAIGATHAAAVAGAFSSKLVD